jgi:hypothetical protein
MARQGPGRDWKTCHQLLGQASSWVEYHMLLHYLRDAHWIEATSMQPTLTGFEIPGYPDASGTPEDHQVWHFKQWQTCNRLIEGVKWG